MGMRLRPQHVGRMHLAHHVGMKIAGAEIEIAAGEPVAVDELRCEALAHVAHHLVREQRHRRAEPLGEAHGRHGQTVHVCHVGGREHHRGVVAVGAPAGLHHVALRRRGRPAGGRPRPHDVHDQERRFHHDGVTDGLLHQREARTRGRGHGQLPRQRPPYARADGADLVLHLQEHAADLGQFDGHGFHDLGGGSDGISGKKAHTRIEGPESARPVPLDEHAAGVDLLAEHVCVPAFHRNPSVAPDRSSIPAAKGFAQTGSAAPVCGGVYAAGRWAMPRAAGS